MTDQEQFYYKVVLSYRGTNYSGWQFQTENPQTVQRYVEDVVRAIARNKPFKVIGASRTDTGVHAKCQVLKIVLPREVDPNNLTRGMNTKLPEDIKVVSSEFIHKKFNPNKDPISKEYHYYFIPNKNVHAAFSATLYYIPEELNLDLMKEACTYLIGTHNFLNFCVMGDRTSKAVRYISHCTIETTSFAPYEPELFYLKIKGPGFLKYMVRFIMGALINIGAGRLSIDEFKYALETGSAPNFKMKAPPFGLHLFQINY